MSTTTEIPCPLVINGDRTEPCGDCRVCRKAKTDPAYAWQWGASDEPPPLVAPQPQSEAVQPSKLAPPAMPSFIRRVRGWKEAHDIWVAAGKPYRTPEQAETIRETCRGCSNYKDGACAVCGCKLEKHFFLDDKPKWATTWCPIGLWGPDVYTGIRLTRKPESTSGSQVHRSGWPAAVATLQGLHGDNGIVFDDYADKTIHKHDEPWIGVFHNPLDSSPIAGADRSAPEILQSFRMQKSLPFLRLAITLSNYLAGYLRTQLDCPVVAIRHPCEIPPISWDADRFDWTLLQAGSYLRNTELIRQIPGLDGCRRVRLLQSSGWVGAYADKVREYWSTQGGRENYAACETEDYVSHDDYDRLLSHSVVVNEVFAASANNVLLECIARNTPIVINPHPAVVEYLGGMDYPLYFNDPAQIPGLLNRQLILEAHDYLKGMNKSWLSPQKFATDIETAVRGALEGE